MWASIPFFCTSTDAMCAVCTGHHSESEAEKQTHTQQNPTNNKRNNKNRTRKAKKTPHPEFRSVHRGENPKCHPWYRCPHTCGLPLLRLAPDGAICAMPSQCAPPTLATVFAEICNCVERLQMAADCFPRPEGIAATSSSASLCQRSQQSILSQSLPVEQMLHQFI